MLFVEKLNGRTGVYTLFGMNVRQRNGGNRNWVPEAVHPRRQLPNATFESCYESGVFMHGTMHACDHLWFPSPLAQEPNL